MSSVNKVILLGRVGADPEVKSFQNGGKVCNLRIATSESWKDKNTGEKQERTEWHSVAIFNEGIVGVVERFVAKGDLIYVEGQLQTRKWQDQSGNDRYSTEVVLKPFNGSVTLIGKTQAAGGSRGAGSDPVSGTGGGFRPSARDQLDDDIPF